MLYLPLILVTAMGVWRGTTPETARRVGLVALGLAAVCVAIAALAGNWLPLYLGAISWPFGALLLLFRVTATLWHRHEKRA